jgi:hypothetical protein
MTSVVISTRWDAATRQTADLTPNSASSILLEWQADPPSVDAAVPDDMAQVMAAALTAQGEVAFRWTGAAEWAPEQARIIRPANRDFLQRAVETATHAWAADVVVTGVAQIAIRLFDFDWDTQGQAVLVLQSWSGDPQPALARLARARTWRDFALEPPVLALVTPIVDGDGAVIAAASEPSRNRIVEAIRAACNMARINVREQA